jgi:hypothetical protein
MISSTSLFAVDQTVPPSNYDVAVVRPLTPAAASLSPQFLVAPARLDLVWKLGGQHVAALADPESGSVKAIADLYRLIPGECRGREHVAQYAFATARPKLQVRPTVCRTGNHGVPTLCLHPCPFACTSLACTHSDQP